MTPPLPDWIRDFRCSEGNYTNIYELIPYEPRLYGTESLFGDWNGQLLLLAQDFCSLEFMKARLDANDPFPFRHAPNLKTNRNLQQLTSEVPFGMLYGSAFAGLLKNASSNSSKLPSHKHLNRHLQDVLRFTIDHMPNLRAIASLGRVSWNLTNSALEKNPPNWRVVMEQRLHIESKGIQIFAHAHPARVWAERGGKVNAFEDWRVMIEQIGSRSEAA